MATARPIPLSPPLINATFPVSFPLPRCRSSSVLGRGFICARAQAVATVFAWAVSSVSLACGSISSPVATIRLWLRKQPCEAFRPLGSIRPQLYPDGVDLQRFARLKIFSEKFSNTVDVPRN